VRDHRILLGVGMCVLALFFGNAHAATLTVLNLNDAGPGSLRGQILAAVPGDTVVFDPGVTGTIPLASTLTVAQNLTIQGPGAGNLTISGQGAVRVFDVTAGALTVSGVTVANGFFAGLGGAFSVASSLTLRNSVLSGNTASNGGAINLANGGSLTVTDSTFANNSGTSVGGGAMIISGNATVTGNTFAGNTASVNGGAINVQPGGVLTIINNTFRANSTPGLGGAMSAIGTVTVISNTFSANQASSGAAIAVSGGNATLHNNVFADQVASSTPAALSPSGDFGTSRNNVFYNNLAGGVADDHTGYGTLNYVVTVTQPLGALANNGGLTQTMLPVAGGAAICAGAAALLPGGITADQRGNPRIAGACLDAGSVQRSAAVVPASSIPTLSTWALLLLASLMAMFGIRRSRAVKH